MKRVLPLLCLLISSCAALVMAAAPGTGNSFTGSFASDDDQRIFYFRMASPGTVTLRTFSYAGGTNYAGTALPAGGFDPSISVYDPQGNLIVYNRDGGCGAVSSDPVTAFCWDASLTLTLPANAAYYKVILTQADNLPNGDTLADSFFYSGRADFTTPLNADSHGFWDQFPSKRTSFYALDIIGAPSLSTTITSASQLPFGITGRAYTPFTFTAATASGVAITWSAVTPLPAGLALNSATGVLSGTPASPGTFSFTIQATDGVQPATQTVSLPVYNPVSVLTISLPSGAAGAEYGPIALSAAGGGGAYSWTVTGLPSGLSASSAGIISGTPAVGGIFPLTVSVTDSLTGLNASGSVTLSVFGFTTSSLPAGTSGSAYSASINATGGTPPYSFSATGVPPGLSLSGAGLLSGTPGTAGEFVILVRAADSAGLAVTASFLLVVGGGSGPLSISGIALPGGNVGVTYQNGVAATGGAAPYAWSILGGSLPQGVSLASNGSIQGIPEVPGTYTFTAQAKDAAGAVASGTFTLAIEPAPLTFSLGTFPAGIVGAEYPVQILKAAGGVPDYTYRLASGNLPPGLALSEGQISGTPAGPGTFSFTITVTDNAGKTVIQGSSLTINTARPDLILSRSSATFSLVAGVAGVPSPASITVRSSVVEQILNYAFSVSPAAGWLNVTGSTTTPGSLTIALDPSASSLAASGTPYAASILVSCVAPSPCVGTAQTIAVSLTVSAPPPRLSLTNPLLSFNSTISNPAPSSQSLGLQNAGGGTITVNSVVAADPWLAVSGALSTLTAGPAGSATVNVNPAGLAAGFYRSTITVSSSAGVATLPVTLDVTQNLTILLGPAGAQVSAQAGGAPSNSNGAFRVMASDSGVVNWTASVVSDSPWVSVTSGSGTASAEAAGLVSYALDSGKVAALAPGAYYASIQVTSSDVSNSPQAFDLVLNVTAATTLIKPTLSPAGLVFTAASGSTTSAQSVTVFSGATAALAYQVSAATSDGAGWLSVSPATGASSAAVPANSSVSVNTAGLTPGVYSGGVSYAFSGEAVRTVNVTLLVLNAGAAANPGDAVSPRSEAGALQAPPGCSPRRLIATQIGLVNNFAQQAGWPVGLGVKLIDDCGSPVNGARVVSTFSNSDSQLVLTPQDSASGVYLGTWTPQNVSSQVTVTATAAVAGSGLAAGTALVTGEVRTNNVPILTSNGTVDVFNPLLGGGLAPGQAIAIYGRNLATQTATAAVTPFQTTLGGTSVQIGGLAAPLYYVSATQINAQIPYELPPGRQYQIRVRANGAVSTPGSIAVVAAAPGVAAFASGRTIAQHAADFTLVTETSPAKPGEYVVLYLVGLGATDNPVATGAAAPSSPLSRPLIPPTVTLNGAQVPVYFAGLTPTAVGLYQLAFQLPANTPSGDLTLAVFQAGALPANVTILAVRR